ncbi:TPR repeat protein [Streptomyces sp. TLI_55]|uniref:tetratricopeptide repeat protein n=1 Tax=Streptomyces sp. TLI_55 TaxID=1938861 RepID=UPI000BC4F883|nr:tetratricopeptide repeat protein [Streptomyces sp. TLI_55]SNX61735.1 TPR repeat protein [Streptomyces sp. TLI_55]
MATESEALRDALESVMDESPERAQRVMDVLSWYFTDASRIWASPTNAMNMLDTLRHVHPEAYAELQAVASQPAALPAPRSVTAGRDIGVAVTGDDNTVVTGDHVDFRGGTFHQPVVGVQHVRHSYGADSAIQRLVPDDWPPAKDVEPLAHGVRPTSNVSGRPLLPPYVEREVDDAIKTVLTGAPAGKFVVVLGEAYAGKTRTALRAVAEVLPDTRVFAPGRGEDLRLLPSLLRGRREPCVLWLDDLDVHLGAGAHGLEPRLLAQLTGQGVVVVATLREEAYDDVRQSVDGRVLDLARFVELPREWSAGERERARSAGDVRLAEAARHSGPEGIAAYLAVGPQLWEDWQRARRADRHPRGHALVRAAIDLARCGLRGPLPQELLVKAHESYEDVTGLERESVADALAWAAEKRFGVLRLLRGGGAGKWEAAPYLVEAVLKGEGHPVVDSAVWDLALEAARTDTAYDFETVTKTAREAFRRAAERGDGRGMLRLGLLAESLGEGAEAEEWLRRAAEAGQTEGAGRLGRMLVERGEEKEAAAFLETAAEAGDGKAAMLLGKVLLGQTRRWLEVGAEADDPEAAHLLGDLLLGSGEFDEASHWYMKAEQRGHAPVARSSGAYAFLEGWTEIAAVYLTRAADAGDTVAADLLKLVRGEPADHDAEEYFKYHGSRAYPLDATHYGLVMEMRGRLDQARAEYEKAYEYGDAYGAYRLAALLDKQGNPDEARTWYRKAAGMGHPAAKKALAENPDTVKE